MPLVADPLGAQALERDVDPQLEVERLQPRPSPRGRAPHHLVAPPSSRPGANAADSPGLTSHARAGARHGLRARQGRIRYRDAGWLHNEHGPARPDSP